MAIQECRLAIRNFRFCYATTKKMEKNAIHAKKYLVLPGPPGPPGLKVLGPVVPAGRDLETLKVPWSWQDRT